MTTDTLPPVAKWTWRIHARPDKRFSFEVLLWADHHDGSASAFKLQRVAVGRHDCVPASLDNLDERDLRLFLQPLLDEAARLGYLPNNMEHVVAAQRAHLEDMRALVFQRAKPE